MSEVRPGLGFFRGWLSSVLWIRVSWHGQCPSLLVGTIREERKHGMMWLMSLKTEHDCSDQSKPVYAAT